MTGADITLQQAPNKIEFSVPKGENLDSIRMIYNNILVHEDGEWLDHATDMARGEMISDVDEVVKVAREQIKQSRKSLPLHFKLLNPFRLLFKNGN